MPYDKKTGKHYDYTKEGISQYKKDTGKGVPYTPFKMSGHTLPGPNQNSALKARQTLAAGGGFGKLSDLGAIFGGMWGGKKRSKQTPVGSSIEGNERPQETQAYVDTGIDDNSVDTGMDDSSANTLATEENTTKVPVDVEVTVNDKKI